MVPKYYFLQMILQDETLTADILPQPPLSPLQCYQKRRLDIQKKMDDAIAILPQLSGADALELIHQREEILRRLDRHGSFWLANSEKSFLPLLQRILRVTPSMIAAYSAALSHVLLNDVTLLLDEGRTRLTIEGRDYIAKTVLRNDHLNTEKCLEIVEKLAEYQCFPKKISFLLPDGSCYDWDVKEERLSRRDEDADQFRRKIIQLR